MACSQYVLLYDLKISIQWESFITLATFVWFLISVTSHVDYQVIISLERFVTLITLEYLPLV